MKLNYANSLSRKNFAKMLTGKEYLSEKVRKEIKEAGYEEGSSRIDKHEAMKIIRHLKNKKVIGQYKTATDIYKKAALQQYEQDEEEKEDELHKKTSAIIRYDVAQESLPKDYQRSPIDYDPRSVLGQSVSETLEKQAIDRAQSIQEVLEKRKKMKEAGIKKGRRPGLIDLSKLPDMDIG